jgi:hypothetical protein
MKHTAILLVFSLSVIIGCNQQSKPENAEESAAIVTPKWPEAMAKGLAAHGTIEKWNEYRSLSYELANPKKQVQLIDLKSRNLRITDSLYVLGFDGEQVWVSPDLAAFGTRSPRFYHNLYFYFFAMPFALADPGINYEDLGEQVIDDIAYHAVKVSYDQGVGDSSEDFYIAHFGRETGLLEVLLYTVTYYSKESHEKYNALVYEWQDVDGLQVTKSIKGYKYDSGRLGDQRYEAMFNKVAFSKIQPNDTLFSIPDISEIDSIK